MCFLKILLISFSALPQFLEYFFFSCFFGVLIYLCKLVLLQKAYSLENSLLFSLSLFFLQFSSYLFKCLPFTSFSASHSLNACFPRNSLNSILCFFVDFSQLNQLLLLSFICFWLLNFSFWSKSFAYYKMSHFQVCNLKFNMCRIKFILFLIPSSHRQIYLPLFLIGHHHPVTCSDYPVCYF